MHSLLEPSETFSRDTELAGEPGGVHARPPHSRSGGMGSTSDRFATCPACTRRVGSNATGALQRHDVPFTRRRNPKVPEACPAITLSGQTALGA